MSDAYKISWLFASMRSPIVKRCLLSLLILLELFSSQHCFCEAGWIDHDTPQDARTAWPFKVVPAPPSPTARGKKSAQDDDTEDKDEDDAKTTVTSHNRRKRVPTQTPSFEPTFPPTETPSVSPTSFTPAPTLPKRIYDLVFSDEFNVPHRKFGDGSDPRWTALEKNDYTNDAQHYYSADNAYTDTDGNLVIKTEAADTEVVGFNDVKFKNERITKHFKSAMLQSWNKFCFTGGIMEAEMALPGRHDVGGLWPAFWLLGNLARHTYVGSSEHVWPWSSTVCTDKSRTAQLVSACDRVEHYGLHTGVGRGSPEIDVFEVQAGNIKANTGNFIKMPVGQPFMSTSYQVAPGRLWRPGEGWWPSPGQWYNNLTGGANTSMNIIFYGTYNHFRDDTNPAAQDYWSDAISFNRQLNASHFGNFHRYRVEWEVPEEASEKNNFTTNHGYIRWFLDGEFVLEVNGEGLSSSGTGGEISSEPMYMLLNTAISTQWGFPQKCPSNCPCKDYNCRGGFGDYCGFSEGFCAMMLGQPIEYKINWVRVYQDKNDPKQKVGCSTPERPTRKFIEAHQKKFMQKGDVHPLKPIQNGGGGCSPVAPKTESLPESCGGDTRGKCDSSRNPPSCYCVANWTGPHCLNPIGYDDIIWDPVDTWADLGFRGPSLKGPAGVMLVAAFIAFVIIVAHVVLNKKRRRMKGYSRVPEYEGRVGGNGHAKVYEGRVVGA